MSNPAGFVWQVAKLAVGSSVAIFWMFRKVHKLFDPIELNNGSLAYVKVGAFYFLMTGCTLDLSDLRCAFAKKQVLKNHNKFLFSVISSYNYLGTTKKQK